MDKQIYYEQLSDIIFILKTFIIAIFTYYTSIKISKHTIGIKNIIILAIIILIEIIIFNFIKEKTNYSMGIIFLILAISAIYSINTKDTIGISIITTVISLGINYVIFFISIIIDFIPKEVFNIESDYINLLIMTIIYLSILNVVFKVRRFKDGIIFIQKRANNEYFDILILNISVSVVLVMSFLNNLFYINEELVNNLSIGMTIYGIIMLITIQKSLNMYYKYKQLEKTLKDTESQLEEKKIEISKLEQENLNFSKISHSISHKQKSLEHKLNEIMMNSEIAYEINVSDKLKEISDEYSKNIATVELSKTEIEQIDDMLKFMQSECIKNNIQFELQLNGNIHHMTNNFVSKDELEILLADHVKDAIIAIEHCDNINGSILVKLGLIDDCYGLYIYDSGIEFEIDTLINLGDKPITTHTEEGGTGMGFLNTFDTLRKHNASLIINEIGKPCKDNYTKAIIIKFDNLGDFKVKTYRAKEIREIDVNNKLNVEGQD